MNLPKRRAIGPLERTCGSESHRFPGALGQKPSATGIRQIHVLLVPGLRRLVLLESRRQGGVQFASTLGCRAVSPLSRTCVAVNTRTKWTRSSCPRLTCFLSRFLKAFLFSQRPFMQRRTGGREEFGCPFRCGTRQNRRLYRTHTGYGLSTSYWQIVSEQSLLVPGASRLCRIDSMVRIGSSAVEEYGR